MGWALSGSIPVDSLAAARVGLASAILFETVEDRDLQYHHALKMNFLNCLMSRNDDVTCFGGSEKRSSDTNMRTFCVSVLFPRLFTVVDGILLTVCLCQVH